jgi:hypothetical protein
MQAALISFYVGKNTPWKLVFKATKNGFDGNSFRTLCSNIGETFVIIKSNHGNVFGGYTPKSWTSSSSYDYDANSFLFLLYSKAVGFTVPVKILHNTTNLNSIYNYTGIIILILGYGPTYGSGHDIYVRYS